MNADKVNLGELSGFSAIEEVLADRQPAYYDKRIYTLDGKCLGSVTTMDKLHQGIYLKVETGDDGVRRTQKVIVR